MRYNGECDKDGCDFQTNRLENPTAPAEPSYYGPGKKVDTTQPLTVHTQFITSDNTPNGDLVEIRRYYEQPPNSGTFIDNMVWQDDSGCHHKSLTDSFCHKFVDAVGEKHEHEQGGFIAKGNMKGMGEAMKLGMVLVLSLWNDWEVQMDWLNSNPFPNKMGADGKPHFGTFRGPCEPNKYDRDFTEAAGFRENRKTSFSDIKVTGIGSGGVPNKYADGSTWKAECKAAR
ncbi:unnamed protein product [Amoebophrya sp. A120]|nr:unnamed protein product [Amoebophrya sp. A120]|eukprot:GSA120T00008222001.1